MSGIVQLKALSEVAAKLGSAVGSASEDGKLGITDIPAFLGLLPSLAALSAVNIDAVKEELKDLDAQEAQELADAFCASFNIPQDSLEAKIEAGLAHAGKLVALVLAVKEIIELVKK